MNFPDFPSVERYLNSLINYEQAFPLGGARNQLKLEPSLRAAARLNLPLSLPGCIHVAGTKGKGSTVAFLEALLKPDRKILSSSSPHVVHLKERVRLNGEFLDSEIWQEGFTAITNSVLDDPPIKLTYFETVFIFCLWAARALKTNAHVIEVGLGGRFDATNILEDTVAVITTVDYDHVEILGETLSAIAADKAGIIKSNGLVVIGRQHDEARRVILDTAAQRNSQRVCDFGKDFGWIAENADQFRYFEKDFVVENLILSVQGTHQRDNAAAAICTARVLLRELTAQHIRKRLKACTIPGRQQFLAGHPDVLVDVAHNPISFGALAETLRTHYPERCIKAVVGMMKDKDAQRSLEAIRSFVAEVIVVELNSPRSYKADALCGIARSLGFTARVAATREDAFIEMHSPDRHNLGLVAGSFYLAGDYLTWRRSAGIA